jgi:hypothetical protein
MTAALPTDDMLDARLLRALHAGRAQKKSSADASRYVVFNTLPPICGMALFVLGWQILSLNNNQLPGPVPPGIRPPNCSPSPFYDNGPNDQGIGWNLLSSLERVGIGFGLACLIGIPLGFLIGRFAVSARWRRRSFRCCGRCRRWRGCRSACWFSRKPTRPRSG